MRSLLRACTAGLAFTSCSLLAGDGPDDSSGTVRVFAAASLAEAFEHIAARFESANPGVGVQLNFGPSSGLREQLLEGAPADVFASADEVNMDRLVGAGLIDGTPSVFAVNVVEIAVPAGNPGGVTGLADLAEPGLLVGLCAAGVPCGDLARRTLAEAGVEPSLDSEEPDVRSLLTKLAADELDVGLVYRTDVLAAAHDVDGIAVPDAVAATTRYPIGVLEDAPNSEGGAAFVRFVNGAAGREVLTSLGFGEP